MTVKTDANVSSDELHLIAVNKVGGLDGTSHFTTTFNLTARGIVELSQAMLANPDILSSFNNDAFKGVIRAGVVNGTHSNLETSSPEAKELFDSDKDIKITHEGDQIHVSIPLKRMVNGAFQDGILCDSKITQNLAAVLEKEIKSAPKLEPTFC